MENEKYVCDNCELEVEADSDFCPRCGTIFIENITCEDHKERDAEGVCVVCSKPVCKECGHKVNSTFLCNQHDGYEIYEGMARVYGSSDISQINYIKGCLEDESLHPFIYSRKSSPMHLGGTDYSLFRASGDFNGHLINEIKLMVPCNEVLEAEKLITELNI